ncbi:MAG: DUF2971 domain-containing protein [Proteobacteria bacterium]|nr:DUF2971 domain-containing protein [Pseudomonadota bacterium]
MTANAWSVIPEDWVTSPFSGELPSTLFRYRSLSDNWVEKRFEFEVLNEAVFLAGADTLNDPDEGRVQWIARGSFEVALKVVMGTLLAENKGVNPSELLPHASTVARAMVSSPNIPTETAKQMHEILGKTLRIACFTTRLLNGPMWTHYGNFSHGNGAITPHGGLCIEYQVDESWRLAGLRPVEYVEIRPEINMLARDCLGAQFAHATSVKSPDWAYEDEWRLVAYIQAKPPWPSNLAANSKLKLEGSVRSVILGLNANGPTVEKIVAAIQTKMPKIAVKRIVRNELTGALDTVRL